MKIHVKILVAVCVSCVASQMAHADWRVWTVTETRHVLRGEAPGSALAVNLGAARNEWVSFQVLLRSDAAVTAVRLEAGELRGPGDAVLRGADRRLYRQHQLFLEVGTQRNEAFKPDWYPDPLIPFEHPVAAKKLEKARFSAVPFDLPANETHGFWVDLYVAGDTAPGDYRGVYRVTADGGKTVDVPITLKVWNFTLPPTPTLVTEFGSPAPRMRDDYRRRAKAGQETEPSDWAAVEAQCAQMLSEHRCNATPPGAHLRPVAQPDGSFRIPAAQVQALREFVDRYHVNALQVPHPSSVVKDPDAQRDALRAWLAAFDQAAKALDRPQLVFYTYLKDEPNTLDDYRYVQKWGRAVREAKSVVKVLVVEQTWTEAGQGGADSAWGDLYGAVDIWCPLFSLHRQESAARRQALGETVWTYTALCQGPPTPWWHIDYPLLNYRVPAWMAWRDHMKGLLYWGGMAYWSETDDPWTQVPVYTGRGAFQQGRKGILFNGEGSLVYPARAAGYDGIVPTVRLKALRDAIEDYEYLAMLERLGKAAEVDGIVQPLVQSWFQWEKEPAAYEKARAKLAEMIVAAAESRPAKSSKASGPLRVHPANPRYFADGTTNHDGSLRAVYLTGSHTWNSLQDVTGKAWFLPNLISAQGYEAYLDFLASHGHNFMRLWIVEHAWDETSGARIAPHPWLRTGPGNALDGRARFDLTKFDPAYFERLRSRVVAARDRGIYVSVMLFGGMWGTEHKGTWRGHPFNAANNVNGINGDPDGDGTGNEIYTLRLPQVLTLQKAAAKKVIATLNDLDNVLYEVANEVREYSTDWQYDIIKHVNTIEAGQPKRHPVGMTGYHSIPHADLLNSGADWISPSSSGGDYKNNPPASDGRKVILTDTDHLWGEGGNPSWVWKSFARGLHPIWMERIQLTGGDLPQAEEIRKAMGDTRRFAERMHLAAMIPRKDLASSGYCLANPGQEYLVYLPAGGEVTVDLSGASSPMALEWFNPRTGATAHGGPVSGRRKGAWQAPFQGEAVLYLKAQ